MLYKIIDNTSNASLLICDSFNGFRHRMNECINLRKIFASRTCDLRLKIIYKLQSLKSNYKSWLEMILFSTDCSSSLRLTVVELYTNMSTCSFGCFNPSKKDLANESIVAIVAGCTNAR